MSIIDCKELSRKIRLSLIDKIQKINDQYGEVPHLEIVQVGDHPSSVSYVKSIVKTCDELSVNLHISKFESDITEKELISELDKLNKEDSIHGIIIQFPLPNEFDQNKIANSISPLKDVDCVHSENLGKLFMGEPSVVPCTPKGIIRALKDSNVDFCGKEVVVVGSGRTVGKPVSQLLLIENATVTLCHLHTKSVKKHTLEADIIIAAAGKAGLISEDMVKDGVIIADAGINVIDGKVCGDVDFDNVSKKASLITPVPGGVGAMTNSMLIENLIELFEKIKLK
ncbi:bifunctional 5,10-methylenetetrahydrofolate dehydrogenase/5,10-methenyltetrahydrofolate cyclohydrolase [Clostridium cylindrosporum]|uniref:Bifunctional protein FolD n=1 Tax=Clostridium cylindrosporum DSM 605 TaxID=1121307 RepID=A0A0J8DFU9_CLOCY|nr:bifunctional 5,10-methylenetetrahydrofolate dehydrogenase/5,10-methenyltetrahydrofolate cyclohydrolase [Clostridium cylindrosporum]KMT23114.1 5,10-methylene-tetrahydrofolate dehydrogenase/methenyl tetrahydrofolate cyclohydrolase FolD [Clostridium cylindrosporum DSM 605]